MATSFIDKARIYCRAGKGGNGAVAFHREKYVAAGGPDGGDGGNGGNVVLVVDDNMSTLMDFRYKRRYIAENGMDGQGSRKYGKKGSDLTIRVPRGTVVRDFETNEIIKDMSDSEPFILCRGGKGGWGNTHFATPTRQVPRFAKSGLEGEEHDVVLELKLLADVGLIGFPNVGKSTLLSVVSKARPKIANYHFTTLYPNLGVVYVDEGVSFVMADIPGIIEGAADGAGLGHDFLRHIDRCRLLVHVVDVSGSEGRDPVADFDAINEELRQYSPELATRAQIVVANKTDIMEDDSLLEALRAHVEQFGYPLFALSAASHTGTRELTLKIAEKLSTLPPVIVYEPEYVKRMPVIDASEPLDITVDDNTYLVEGKWLQRLMSNINFSDHESRMYFDKMLRDHGVFAQLEAMGIQDGDIVSMYNLEFEYQR
ncbi:MAG: GTPase ObgE [Oscillospiraceae bacterium]|nr:GTPase ObgE [Oscillospiraceae bacterium]MDY6020796.1 GTPase ObgE [Oscillospiraceae bacterium]